MLADNFFNFRKNDKWHKLYIKYFFFSEMGSHSLVEADTELKIILLSHPPECWDYRCRLPCPALKLNPLLANLTGIAF